MQNPTTLIERYLDVWNEHDEAARLGAVAALWDAHATYTDPLVHVEGCEEIAQLIGAVQSQAPGHVFRLLNGVDAHHNVARFGWELVPEHGGEPLAVGFDVAVTNDDGRIASVIGFLDKVPAA